jgi:ferredoxin-NADP reductase
VVERDMLKAKTLKYVDILNAYDGQPDPSIFVGLINANLIKETVGPNWQTQNYFMCGSPGFIKVVKGMLKEIGVPARNIYLEELGF